MSETRDIVICGGGDWCDASVDFVVVPRELDLDAAMAERSSWYQNEYCPQLRSARERRGDSPRFYTVKEWLLEFYNAKEWEPEILWNT